jgi:hypothetical protein
MLKNVQAVQFAQKNVRQKQLLVLKKHRILLYPTNVSVVVLAKVYVNLMQYQWKLKNKSFVISHLWLKKFKD